ncbi:hypothetical protein COV05_04320 [Candidatus Uhrbacteria bacterium CG10_big_fil_rev_8_21_14_0_10_48_16]|uniref:Uncharacterized protein n=1 Tax=Candidatus Uhrbacteria bacterium CG10_big_fil_rev_8_21_14_0_10_48_16 TaxID=1975038 RepID=A0A2M8LGN2_9BACT|nr:MAG: hypothetical protein COV05_04320 [Candidatus Uhrbacteria bacterium CG10_big_fil_rev_8_21_14_0_10_48_16]
MTAMLVLLGGALALCFVYQWLEHKGPERRVIATVTARNFYAGSLEDHALDQCATNVAQWPIWSVCLKIDGEEVWALVPFGIYNSLKEGSDVHVSVYNGGVTDRLYFRDFQQP